MPTTGPVSAATPRPTRPPNPFGVVDATTLDRKIVFGYQGWFSTPGDPIQPNWDGWGWNAWVRDLNLTTIGVDNWPDLTEFDDDELYPTGLSFPDGRTVRVFRSTNAKTVLRHFRWMGEFGIDGVYLQRFLMSKHDQYFDRRNRVTELVREGAETYGRVFAVEFCFGGAGLGEDTLVDDLIRDWRYLVDEMRLTDSDRYLRHDGKPVLLVYGVGFEGPASPRTPADAMRMIDWFRRDAPERYRATLVGGIPYNWRTLGEPSRKDPGWAEVYRSFDLLKPWYVGGGLRSDADVIDRRRTTVAPDQAAARAAGKQLMPTINPGFSWLNKGTRANLPFAIFNDGPRRGGATWWRQLYEYMTAGCTTFFGAMFDEIEEGTAIFKLAPTAAQAPRDARFVTLDADGIALPSDWYLKLAGAGARMLRGEIPLSPRIPISP